MHAETRDLDFTSAFSDREMTKLRQYKVIFVPGFLSDAWSDTGLYFYPQLKLLNQAGVESSVLKFRSGASSKKAGQALAQAVLQSDKPVVLITHSKGGLDALIGLVDYPQLLDHVKGWIQLQGPIHGTKLVPLLLAHYPESASYIGMGLEMAGADLNVALDFDPRIRELYLKKNATAIAAITTAIPTLSVGTYLLPAPNGLPNTAFYIPKILMDQTGGLSDGLVSPSDSKLPGSNHLIIPRLDHNGLILPMQNAGADLHVFLFRILLHKMQ